MMRLLLLTILFIPCAAPATSMVPVNLETMIKFTEKAFAGEVLEVDVVETPHGWGEYVLMRVEDPVLAATSGETVSWVQMRLGPETRFPGMPEFVAGQKALIFLSGKGRGTSFQAPFGLGQGAFALVKDDASTRTLAINEYRNANLYAELDIAEFSEKLGQRGVQEAATVTSKAAIESRRGGAVDVEFLKKAARALKE